MFPHQGGAFLSLLGETLTIEGARLSYRDHAYDAKGRPTTYGVTKTIALLPCTSPQGMNLEQTGDAQGWSRRGIVTLRGNTLTLAVNFPQNPPPPDFVPSDDGREIAVLDRLAVRSAGATSSPAP